MNINQQRFSPKVVWSVPASPTYEHLYARVSRVLPHPEGLFLPSGNDLMFVNYDGSIVWKTRVPGGVWGYLAELEDDQVACANLLESIYFINIRGEILRSITLPASANTNLLPGIRGEILVGVGSRRCDALCITQDGRIKWQSTVSRDDGFTHGMYLDRSCASVWAPTDEGLKLLDYETGNALATAEHGGRLRCLSGVLPWREGVLVAAANPAGQCVLLHSSATGEISASIPLPMLRRARLIQGENDLVWLLGSTASGWDPVKDEDRVVIIGIEPNRTARVVAELPGDRSVDGTFIPGQGLWVGTYTYDDDTDRGALYLLNADRLTLMDFSPELSAGVGVPVAKDALLYVPTSTGLVCLRLGTP